MNGWDCASPVSAAVAQAFAGQGYTFVCRYLVPNGWKRLTNAEVTNILNAGLHIVSVFEQGGSRALEGYDAGYADGQTALAVAGQIGQPEGTTIYGAVDFAPQPDQMATILDYIRGFSAATPNYTTGVYGSYDVILAAQAAGVCSHFWQTYAWSHGRVADNINLHQYDNGSSGQGQMINGINVDLNHSFGNEGWWGNVTVDEPTPIAAPAEPIPDSISGNVFTDVPDDHWNVGNLKALKDAGIISGYEDGTFHGDQNITRHETAAMAAKVYTKVKGLTTVAIESVFTDVPAEHWNAANLQLLKEAGIVSGYEDGTFRGDQDITRHEAAALIANLYKQL